MSIALTEARQRVIALFQELEAGGVEVVIETNFGGPPTLDFHNDNDYIELSAAEWRTE